MKWGKTAAPHWEREAAERNMGAAVGMEIQLRPSPGPAGVTAQPWGPHAGGGAGGTQQ